jgi:hypothetical protein
MNESSMKGLKMNIQEKHKARVIATSFEDSYLVESYPYGRKRTQRRSWIESNKTHGDRVCHCTLNPKTQKWNKPKKSTYDPFAFLYIEDETGHIKSSGIGTYTISDNPDYFNYIYDNFELNNIQKSQLNKLKAFNKVMKNVTFKIEKSETYNLSDPEDVARMRANYNSPEAVKKRQEQKDIENKILNHANYEYHKLQKVNG